MTPTGRVLFRAFGNPVHYYNEFDDDAADCLESLMRAGLIPHGIVDRRDIRDVRGSELARFTQCHFFAGIGGWPLALRLAGWPETEPVWTGSCPCQPFSGAGRRRGFDDERHLWPQFGRLIANARPAAILGEQVASSDGREWLARVRDDVEVLGYGVGAADLCASGVGAPHIRQRLYWLAHAGCERRGETRVRSVARDGRQWAQSDRVEGYGLADADGRQLQRDRRSGKLASTPGSAQSEGDQWERRGRAARDLGPGSGARLADADGSGLARPAALGEVPGGLEAAERNGVWGDCEWIDCGNGQTRRIKSGVRLLVDGLPRDVAPALRGLGNAIVPPLAAEFIRAAREILVTQ